jgi:hypothetical protein
MSVKDAFQIVIELARQNLVDKIDMPEEHARQLEAINTLEDIAVNQFGWHWLTDGRQ